LLLFGTGAARHGEVSCLVHYLRTQRRSCSARLTGLVFGFLLQKGGVTRYNVIVNQFRFKDFTVLKTMLTAIVVGRSASTRCCNSGMIKGLSVKSAELAMNAGGGLIFGVGMVLLGYCPGHGAGGRRAGVARRARRHRWSDVSVRRCTPRCIP
jgi:hypothetical protein